MRIVPVGDYKTDSQTVVTDKETIIAFLAGRGTDYKGRTIFDMLDCDDFNMEKCHDQCQWFAPLHEESNFAKTYPIITPEIIEEANKEPFIKKHLRWMANRMKMFYGINGKQENWGTLRFYDWMEERNHNLLRITRIIRSLRLFGLDEEAKDFYERVLLAHAYVKEEDKRFNIDESCLRYWNKAMFDDIWKTLR